MKRWNGGGSCCSKNGLENIGNWGGVEDVVPMDILKSVKRYIVGWYCGSSMRR